jgi:lipoprotein-releasing system ATP-binding protein
MLEVSSLGKVYPGPGGALETLSNVSFTLKDGEAAAITGPSGSGKSTLLYMLGGLEPPSSGSVRVAGRDLYALPAEELARYRNSHIGFVFQDHCLLPQLSVLENVLIPTLVAPAPEKDPAGYARTLIDRIGLTSRIDHRPGELSGGERQRVAIARALICSPRLVLCDEPTGNLDPASADSVANLLVDLHRQFGSILIVVTHSMRLAAQFPIRFDVVNKRLERAEAGAIGH